MQGLKLEKMTNKDLCSFRGVEYFLFFSCLLQPCSAVSALTYYGICMNVGSFGVDVYSAQFFSGLSETPCLLIPLLRLGRRALSMLTLLLSGASCFLSLLLSIMDGDLPKLSQNYVFLYLSSFFAANLNL